MSKLALDLIAKEKIEQTGTLDLGNCGLTELPEELFELVGLERLYLSHWRWDWKWDWKGHWIASNNQGVKNNLETFSKGFSKLENLKELQIQEQNISDFTILKACKKLLQLNLYKARIVDISFLKELTNLTNLGLSYNEITDISILKQLSNLTSLFLKKNQITDISSLEQLNSLTNLDLSYNQIIDISFLKQLTNFNLLDLRNNQIININPLSHLTQPQSLFLNNNEIEDITSLVPLMEKGLEVSWEAKVDKLSIGNNPLKTPPPEIIKEGQASVLGYFKEIKEQGGTPLYEAKMLIVGEGGAGKTTLAEKLQDEDCKMPEECETTKGIDIHELNFTTKAGNEFVINLWDFGGQEIYHSTHQFFLTKRSLYILVDDTRKDDKSIHDPSFNYWLQTVDLFGAGSPLLIVQNEKGGRSKALDIGGMKSRFGEMIKNDPYPTNLLTKKGLAEVKEAIFKEVQKLPHVGHTLPKKWIEIRNVLLKKEQEGLSYISLREYYEICKSYGIPEKKRALWLSKYLHDLGMFLHFQDEKAGVLKKTIVLKNSWATEAVYKIIDDEEIKKNKGTFEKSATKRIWDEEKYCDMHDELLGLMNKFELCYELRDTKKRTFLVPQLMPVPRSTYDWNEENNLQLNYQYGFMPKGLISRFMIRLNRHVQQPNLAWRSGVILEKGTTRAEVIETYGKREITIRVEGNARKVFLNIISDAFDELHRQFEGLKVEKKVPCNCATCKNKKVPNFYKYSDLVHRRSKNKRTIECYVSFDDVDVLRLIDDVLDNPFFKNEKLSPTEMQKFQIYAEELAKGKNPPYEDLKARTARLEAQMEGQSNTNINQTHRSSGDNVNKKIVNNFYKS